VLSPKTPSVLPAGQEPLGLAVSPDGGSVYVTNRRSDDVSQDDVGGDGTLSPKSPAAVPAGDVPLGVAVSPLSRAPTTKQQCKNGGYRQFGSRNQGQCIAFVNRGRPTADGAASSSGTTPPRRCRAPTSPCYTPPSASRPADRGEAALWRRAHDPPHDAASLLIMALPGHADGSITVDVHQAVFDARTGELVSDSRVRDRYRLVDGLVVRMDLLREPPWIRCALSGPGGRDSPRGLELSPVTAHCSGSHDASMM
jgi:DNA-binding beta-propeller fold protein YncE